MFRVPITQGQKYLQVGGAQGQRYHNPCQYVAVLGLSCSMQDLLVVAWELPVTVCGIQGTRDQTQPPLHWECGALASGSPRKFLWPEWEDLYLTFFLPGCRGTVCIPAETSSREVKFYYQDPKGNTLYLTLSIRVPWSSALCFPSQPLLMFSFVLTILRVLQCRIVVPWRGIEPIS